MRRIKFIILCISLLCIFTGCNSNTHINNISTTYDIWDRTDDKLLITYNDGQGWVLTDLDGKIIYDEYIDTLTDNRISMHPYFVRDDVVRFNNQGEDIPTYINITTGEVLLNIPDNEYYATAANGIVWTITDESTDDITQYTLYCYNKDQEEVLKQTVEGDISDADRFIVDETGALIIPNDYSSWDGNKENLFLIPEIQYTLDQEKINSTILDLMSQNEDNYDELERIENGMIYFDREYIDRNDINTTYFNIETASYIDFATIPEFNGAEEIEHVSMNDGKIVVTVEFSDNLLYTAILNYNGELLCPPTTDFQVDDGSNYLFSSYYGFSEGLCWMRSNTVRYSNQYVSYYYYGYVDEFGEWVSTPEYIDCGDFANGRAVVEFDDGSCGVIDKKGNVIFKSNP